MITTAITLYANIYYTGLLALSSSSPHPVYLTPSHPPRPVHSTLSIPTRPSFAFHLYILLTCNIDLYNIAIYML